MAKVSLINTYKKYPTYKDSGVKWLGEIPKDWEVLNLQWLYQKLKRTGFQDEELLSVYRDRGVIKKSSRNDNHNKASEDLSTYQLVNKGDLAINKMKAWQGSLAISPYQGIVSPAYYVCRPLTENNPRFIHYLLRSKLYIKQYEQNSGGVRNNQWDLRYESFRKIEAVIPPKEVQKKIAKFLDEQTARIDESISKKQRLIELLKEKRTATINHAVTRGLDKHVKLVDSGIRWMGHIPEKWNASSLKTLLVSRITDGPHTTPILHDEGIEFISAESIQANNTINFNKRRGFISKEDHKEYCKKACPQRDDIFMVKSGATTGRVAIVETDKEFSIWSPLALMRTNKEKANAKFVYYFLQSSLFQDQVKVSWSYGTQQNIGMRVIENLQIVYPDKNEQRLIADYLDKKMPAYNQALEKVEISIAKLQEFKSSLISHAVTGKIKV